MNKYVVISTNDNEDYLHYLPIVVNAWNEIGWNVICIYRGVNENIQYISDNNIIIPLNHESIYREATLVQVSRLFAACLELKKEDYLLTSDVDMLPCFDYWKFEPNQITVWGYDLTDCTEYPICYIGMNVEKWRDVMNISPSDSLESQIESFLDKCPNAISEDFYKWWGVDQQEITKLLMPREVNIINRGKLGDYAIGRVDRGNWDSTLNQQSYIDAHLPRPAKSIDSIQKVQSLLLKLNLKPKWYEEYTRSK